MGQFVLAIDQGTTSSRAIVFDQELGVAASSQQEFPQHFPRSGWVEHDPDDIWQSTIETCREAMTKAAASPNTIAAIGITNQRETTIVWDRETGKPIHNAIVWQDRRTAKICQNLKSEGHEPAVSAKTGLLLDPYFSATKIAWLLDNVDGARNHARTSQLAFGTIDCFLLWHLTGGRVHATDATNASRTMLFDIHENVWSQELCELFDVPMSILPEVHDCASDFGETDPEIFGAAIPIAGIAGDQQAAAIGQACFEPGMVKSTYGTGCFALMNTGSTAIQSTNRLLTTIAYRFNGETTYALEGSIFIAGAAVQWLRDGLGLITAANETDELASKADSTQDVYLVPAFVGLGAPHWDADCRGALFGLTRATGRAEIARATLSSVCYQTRDLIEAMQRDRESHSNTALRVDGGMTASNWTMQHLADILDTTVDRPTILETTAVGAAWLAGSRIGMYPARDDFAATWKRDKRFDPQMAAPERERLYRGWTDAIQRTLSRPTEG